MTTLIIAAHGSRHDTSVNDHVRNLARSLRNSGRFDDVVATFHQGEPSFDEVLGQVSSTGVIVVPLMTSDGYYSDVVLPRELRRHPRFATLDVHITTPIGTHPMILDMVADRVAMLANGHLLPLAETVIGVVGHGTTRHEQSRRSTEELGRKIERLGIAAKTFTAFLDEEPSVQSLRARTGNRHLIVIPFLISDGYHVRHDIPERLGFSGAAAKPSSVDGAQVPIERGGRWTIVDRPVGTDRRIGDVVMALATETVSCRMPQHAVAVGSA